MANFCDSCGAKIGAGEKFCPECGAAVESAAGNPAPTPQPVAKNHVNENASGLSNGGGQRNKGLIYGIGAVLLVAALGGGFYFMNHSAGSTDGSVKIVKVTPKKDTKDKAEEETITRPQRLRQMFRL